MGDSKEDPPSSQPTDQANIYGLLIYDWRWQPFDEEGPVFTGHFPSHGWCRAWLEETENGLIFEVREWYFGRNHRENQTVISIDDPPSKISWPDDVA